MPSSGSAAVLFSEDMWHNRFSNINRYVAWFGLVLFFRCFKISGLAVTLWKRYFKEKISATVMLMEKVCWLFPVHMASSLSGQNKPNPALSLATRAGKMALSCPLGTTRCVPQEQFSRKPYNKSCIDQACSVKMAWHWPRSCLCVFMDGDRVEVHKHANLQSF